MHLHLLCLHTVVLKHVPATWLELSITLRLAQPEFLEGPDLDHLRHSPFALQYISSRCLSSDFRTSFH